MAKLQIKHETTTTFNGFFNNLQQKTMKKQVIKITFFVTFSEQKIFCKYLKHILLYYIFLYLLSLYYKTFISRTRNIKYIYKN